MQLRFQSSWLLGLAIFVGLVAASSTGRADNLPVVSDVEFQPLSAQAKRIADALELLGQPLSRAEKTAPRQGRRFHRWCRCDPGNPGNPRPSLPGRDRNQRREPRQIDAGPCPASPRSKRMVRLPREGPQPGRCHRRVGRQMPQRRPTYLQSTGRAEPKTSIRPSEIVQRWADLALYKDPPLKKSLSGLSLEYRIIQVYSRDAGKREARISFNVGQGTQDLGFRSDVDILFNCEPAVAVMVDVRDEDGRPDDGLVCFSRPLGACLPFAQSPPAPDFFFHPQVYRRSGESVLLPPGTYESK